MKRGPREKAYCYPRTVYPKKSAHGFCFAVLCCGYTLTDFPISIRLTSLALWQSDDCPSASKATLMNMDKYFIWIHYERLYNHNKAKHNKTVCIFLGIYCTCDCHRLITTTTTRCFIGEEKIAAWQFNNCQNCSMVVVIVGIDTSCNISDIFYIIDNI